jgi:hypothetical protein
LLPNVLVRHRHRRLTGEGRLPGEHLVQDDAERVDVGAGVDGSALGLLRGEVRDRSQDGRRSGKGVGARGPSDAEVHHLHVARRREHDVPGLDVPVDESVVVCELQRRRHPLRDLRGAPRVDRSVLGELVGQRRPLDELHHDVVAPAVRAAVVHGNDTWIVELRGGLGLPPEPPDEVTVPRVLGREDLHRHRSVQDAVGAPVHGGHAARAEDLAQLVTTIEGVRSGHPVLSTRSRCGVIYRVAFLPSRSWRSSARSTSRSISSG